MKDWYIYVAVVVSGACVLAVEILGTRIIGPFYGVSLYLWSALIGVTLAALSLGYYLGGLWADRGPRLSRLCLLLALAGLWIVWIPWLRHPVLAVAEPLGLRSAVLLAATVLFFPPLATLGMVSPYAIRLKVTTIDVVGRTAGNLYAISTIASVLSAVFTGFFLIPNIGVSRLTFLVGVVLVVTALVGFAATRRRGALAPSLAVLGLAGTLTGAVAPVERPKPDMGLLAIEQSAYGELRVVETSGLRYLLIDGGIHTIVEPATWQSRFPYVDVLDIPRLMMQRRGKALVVGLGGGSVVKRYAQALWQVDAVEIDPVVTAVAYEHFGLRQDEARVYHMDGRRYLATHDEIYDLIVMDAFGSSSIPFHLVTREAFGLAASRLAPGGMLAVNVEAVGWEDVIVRALAATLEEHFDGVVALPIAEPPDRIGNVILLGSRVPLDADEELPDPQDRFGADYNRVHAWVNRFEPDTRGVPVLTDDLNPVDVWAERINLVARGNLHDFFGSQGLSW